MADQFGASTRTIRRLVAEPREEFLARARARRERAVELRAEGLTYKAIGETMGISAANVGRLLYDARQLQQRSAADQ